MKHAHNNPATNFAMLLMALAMASTFLACEKKDDGNTFTDARDGKKYRFVKIGEQTWMAEDLKFNAQGSKCYEDNELNCQQYGRLYDWNTAMQICPSGWHLPTLEEWWYLAEATGDKETAGKKLKSKTGWSGFQGKHGGGTDDFGFSALPGISGNYSSHGAWWSATGLNETGSAFVTTMCNEFDYVYEQRENIGNVRFSMRCVMDDAEALARLRAEGKARVARSEAEREAEWEDESKNCPNGKIGSPTTIEAVLGETSCVGGDCGITFYFGNDNSDFLVLNFIYDEAEGITIDDDDKLWFEGKILEIGVKVSVTYQKRQDWIEYEGSQWCHESIYLRSLKILSKGEEGPEDCPSKTGPLQTAEATFLEIHERLFYMTAFRLADGNELVLRADRHKELIENLKKGVMVSVTYQDRQVVAEGDCWEHKALESLTILGK